MVETNISALEIHILPLAGKTYPVTIRLSDGRDFSGVLSDEICTAPLPNDPRTAGQWLFDTLFSDPELRRAWDIAYGTAAQRRVRLRVDGVESLLVNRAAIPPAFDETQRIEIP